MPPIPRMLMHQHWATQEDHNVFHIKNSTGTAFAEHDIVSVIGSEGDAVFEATLAKAATAIDARQGFLLSCLGPIPANGGVGFAVRRKLIPFNTNAATGVNVVVFLSETTFGVPSLSPGGTPRTIGLVFGAPAVAGYVLFCPDEELRTPVADFLATETPTGGLWIDGKAVYRKVLAIAAAAVGVDVPVALGLAIDTLVSVGGFIEEAGGEFYPLPASGDGTDTVQTQLVAAKNSINVIVSAGFEVVVGRLIVEYTK